MSSNPEKEEKEAVLDDEDDENESLVEAEPDERQDVDVRVESMGESDTEIEASAASSKKIPLSRENVDELRDVLWKGASSHEGKASGSGCNHKRKTKSEKTSSANEDSDDSTDDSDSFEPELLQSTDSDSDNEKSTAEPKTLEKLGITLNKSKRFWKSHKSLRSREIGIGLPHLFTRNVTGSLNMVQKFQLERKLEYHGGCVNTLNFNASGDLLASGSDDLNVVLWDWATGKKRCHYDSGHTGNVFQVST